jgi:dipeptidyl aminopeptidase/acylaminoacyl peptidase
MTTPLTPETLVYGFQPAADPAISPDGSKIAFTRTITDKESGKATTHLWLTDRTGAQPRQLTFTGRANASPRWSPSGEELAFVSDRVERSAIFILPMSGGEAREVTRSNSQIGDLAWSPDGTRLGFTAPFDPDNPSGEKRPPDAPAPVRVTTRIDYKQDGFGYLGERRTQVYVVAASGGEPTKLTDTADTHTSPQWSPDGSTVLFRVGRDNGMSGQLCTAPAEGGAIEEVTPSGWSVTTWVWSADGASVVFSGEPERTGQPDFHVIDLATKSVRRITDDLPVLPDGGFAPLLPPSQPVWRDSRSLLFHAFHRGRSGTWALDIETGQLSELESENEVRTFFSIDASRRYAVQAASSLERAGEIALVDLAAGKREIITSNNTSTLQESPPARWERIDITRGGLTIEGWLLFPPDFDESKKYPLVLDIHGGPQGYYGYNFVVYQQALATHGIPVLFSNPRGSSSYGRDFTSRVIGDWGGEDYEDLMAILDEALKRPYFDRERTGIWGYSYGGYMTAWTIARNHRFKAAVCGAPCFDLESMFGTSDISHFFGVMNWTGTPWNAREWYATHSPSQFAHNTVTPTLIIQGEADERCPVGQGEQMFVTLKKAGCEVEFARYPGGYHGFMRSGPPAHREDALRRIVGWFSERL